MSSPLPWGMGDAYDVCGASMCPWDMGGGLEPFRFGPREAGDGEMRQGATGRRQGGDRKTTGW